ncbi:MAG: dihydrofolate reductase family protein [Actinomycetota bacterium]
MARVRLWVAASVDGFIADTAGGIGWLKPFEALDYGFDHFLSDISTLVMGRATYEQVRGLGRWPYPGRRTVVVTSRSMDTAPDEVEPWLGDIAELAAELKKSDGDAWVMGGAKAIRAFLDVGAIERIQMLMMPVLLGAGIPLFLPAATPLPLLLLHTRRFENGVVELDYAVTGRNAAPQPAKTRKPSSTR